jgi:hypothetical protein
MKNRIVLHDEAAVNIKDFLVKFRKDNPHYPTDPWGTVTEDEYDQFMTKNLRHQKRAVKDFILNMEEAPF